MTKLIRSSVVDERLGIRRSTRYRLIDAGLLTPPLYMPNGKVTVWPDYEVDILAKAIINGKSEAAIKEIVLELIAERNQANDENFMEKDRRSQEMRRRRFAK